MKRDEAYMRILRSTANMQENIAMMLEAKADEAEKLRSWIIHNVNSGDFGSQQEQLSQSLRLHQQVIDVIRGVTKINESMVAVMNVVLPKEDLLGAEGGFSLDDGMGDDFTIGEDS